MGNALAIARRELGAFFGQPTAYVFMAAFLSLAAMIGLAGFFERNVADLRDYFAGLRFAFMLLAPAAAMRLWAEERRLGTFELLLTLPVRPVEAVLGKYLAGLGLIGATLLVGTALPISLAPFGDFDGGQLAAGYLGAFLLGATYLAVGLLASALTESQVTAFVLGALGCVVLGVLGDPLLLGPLERVLPGWAVQLTGELGVTERYEGLTRGVVDSRDLAYFVGVSAALLFWNTLAVERREPERGEPRLALALSLGALLLWVSVTSDRALHGRLDATSAGRNSLAPGTREVLDGVEAPLTIRAYLSGRLPESARPEVRRVLDLLEDLAAALEGRCVLEVIDPGAAHLSATEQKRLAAQAEREGVTRHVLQVKEEDRIETVQVFAGVSFLYAGRPPAAIPRALGRANLEYDVATAVQRLVLPRLRIGLAGRGAEDYGGFEAALEQASYSVQRLDLSEVPEVPGEVACLVYAAPAPPSAREAYVLDQYVAGGGTAIVLAEGHLANMIAYEARAFAADGPLRRTLAAWGLELGPGLLLAPSERGWTLQADGAVVQSLYPWFLAAGSAANPDSPVAADLRELVFLPFASEVDLGDLPPGAEGAPLLRHPAWVLDAPELDVHPLRPVPVQDQGDPRPRLVAAAVRGPLPSAWAGGEPPPASADALAAAEGVDPLAEPLAEPAGPGAVVLVGDADFLRDAYQAHGRAGVPFALNLVDWALDRSLAGLRSRAALPRLDDRTFILGTPRADFLRALHLLLPWALAGAALLVVRRRRSAGARRAAAARDAKAKAVAEGAGGAP